MVFTLKSALTEFYEDKEEVERKAPVVAHFFFGIGAFLLPLTSSGLYSIIDFRSIMDILGVLYGLYAIGFTVYAATNKWGRMRNPAPVQ